MKRLILTGILIMAAGISIMAQQQRQAPPAGAAGQAAPAAAPAAPTGPMPKSQEEAAALQALISAQNDPDAIIKAADDLIARFADTQFKELIFTMEAEAY